MIFSLKKIWTVLDYAKGKAVGIIYAEGRSYAGG
jgi:hypothetical protein